ncbi:MAG: tRNA (guanosine(46)-N7)-methyltransferase TrmB [Ignavibacteria bacterium]|jgi:tRNA (guanine-N7-)-methyltransferase
MGRTKLKKLRIIKDLENVFGFREGQNEKDIRKYFGNNNPVTLELGCGHGEYTFNLAKEFPERNFIGIDIKGSRLYNGAIDSIQYNIPNAAFLITRIEKIHEVFESNKIEEIIIPFPDPHVRRRSEKHRLVSPIFLSMYKSLLTVNGKVHLKTDNTLLYEYALHILEKENINIIYSTNDLHADGQQLFIKKVYTRYEQHYIKGGRKIKYICFNFAENKG